ncbi:MAG: dienelactone hydrolase family protein [Deltaproteobacteria bacterium]|nr:dienelactone hydrolase family protein [Deltaproteobacteria bacterium]
MKRLVILLVAAMLSLVLACGRQEAKAPAKPVAPPEKAEKAAPQAPPAQVARMEIHSFQSMTLTDQEFLSGRKEGKPVTLAGELRLPRPGNDRLPVVVLLHGSGGVSGNVLDWEQDLNAMGVATFVLDSFTGRGIVNTLYDQSQLGRLSMIVDVYRVLDVLAKHPRIDPTRIALMGFSRGGQAALYASLKRFQRLHGPVGQEFAAYLVLYPLCNTTYHEDEDVADKPIRIFHGRADDYAPVAPCRAYVERLQAKGKNVQLTEYAGAGHNFDNRALKTPLKLEKAPTTRRCELAEAENGVIVNVKTKLPFTSTDPCVEYGPTLVYDEKASTEARRAVKDFITTTLKP